MKGNVFTEVRGIPITECSDEGGQYKMSYYTKDVDRFKIRSELPDWLEISYKEQVEGGELETLYLDKRE